MTEHNSATASGIKSVPPPGYIAHRPQYPVIRRVNKILGAQATLVNLVEVSLRYFESDMNKSSDQREFVDSICSELGINSSLGVNWSEVRYRVHSLALVQLVVAAEEFVRKLTQEYRAFSGRVAGSGWVTQVKDKELDDLAILLENLPAASKLRARACPEYALWQYFRRVRNYIIHGVEPEEAEQKLATAYEKLLQEHGAHFDKCYGRQPSRFRGIVYDDFYMFARAVNYYAKILNDACDLQPEQIVKWLIEKDARFLVRLRQRKARPNIADWYASALAQEYRMDHEQKMRAQIALQSFLDADPPAKVRRQRATRTDRSRKKSK